MLDGVVLFTPSEQGEFIGESWPLPAGAKPRRWGRVILLSHCEIGEGRHRAAHAPGAHWIGLRDPARQDQAVAAAEEVAGTYLAAWTGGGLDLIWDLYAAGAVVVDDVRGLSARGQSGTSVSVSTQPGCAAAGRGCRGGLLRRFRMP